MKNMAIIPFRGKKPKIHPTDYIADSATLIGDVILGKNVSIFPGAVLRGDMHYIKIGDNCSIQDNSVLHGTATKYPTIVGKNVSIGHNAIVHGCRIGDNCIIGMGAIILEGARIGDWCIIAAGAVVPEGAEIKDGSIAMGIPAKAVKKTTLRHKRRITYNWKEYVKLNESYRRQPNESGK